MVQGCQVPGSGYRIRCPAFGLDEGCGESRIFLAPHLSMAEGRIPSTEDRARPPENARTGYASCIVPFIRRPMPDSYIGNLDPTVGRMVPVYRLIAQNLNSVRPDVRRALSENRWTPIDRLIRRLARVGVYGIDIQLDWPGADRVALYEAFIRRLHETAPEVRPVIDWPDAAAWARLVPRCPVRPVVNSLPAHPLRPAALDVIGQFRPEVIVLCATEETTRLTPAERLELAYEAYRALRACGLEDEAIYFDAVLFPLVYRRPGADPTDTLETIRRLRYHFPRCHVLVGLANLTFRWGADERAKTVGQATFLAMAVAAGLDAVIMDPLVPVLRRVWSSAQAILRRDGGAT